MDVEKSNFLNFFFELFNTKDNIEYKIVFVIFLITYYIYYKTYSNYTWIQHERFKRGKKSIGNTLPSMANGWFRVCSSDDIKVNQIYYFDLNSYNIVIFRGEDKNIYAVDAYCTHMGANLIDGHVSNNCIVCPFHNWKFEGKTGKKIGDSKNLTNYKFEVVNSKENGYSQIQFTENKSAKESNLSKNKIKVEITDEEKFDLAKNDNCSPDLKNYITFENSGDIYIYLHAIREKELKPTYYPFDLTTVKEKLCYRGKAINKSSNQFQDMPENGADFSHFLYIHPVIIPYLVYGFWKPSWIRANDPKLQDKIKSEHNYITEFRKKLISKFVNKNNESDIGIVLLENEIQLFGCGPKIFFFGLIGFQLGPGLVYLFLKSPFFETFFFQYSDNLSRTEKQMTHEIWTQSYIPYWLSALKLTLEAHQVRNDCKIWDNKKFGANPWYRIESDSPDEYLVQWRKFFCQFYDGCYEREQELKSKTSDW